MKTIEQNLPATKPQGGPIRSSSRSAAVADFLPAISPIRDLLESTN